MLSVPAETEQLKSEATFHIYVRGSKAKRGEVVWAKRVKAITFELSDFEREALQAMT